MLNKSAFLPCSVNLYSLHKSSRAHAHKPWAHGHKPARATTLISTHVNVQYSDKNNTYKTTCMRILLQDIVIVLFPLFLFRKSLYES
jgi:hypothetical protein